MAKHHLDYSPKVSDDVRKTTCYMCACRCGIDVHLKDGKVSHIEGNKDHPVNKGVLCAKGAAGIMQHYSPARLKKPLLRVGERGKSEFKEIEWDEALELAVSWLKPIRDKDPKKLAFFTGRDQSQSLTGWWAQMFGTPNFAAHGGFCSVNMAAGGIYTMGGSFWEFGQPDWERTKLFVMFGVAEDHDSNPIKTGIGKLKANGGRMVSVNPIRTGYSAVADDWIGVRPGTDGMLVLALIHELFVMRKIDLDYLIRYTNAPWLVIDAPGTENHGLFARDKDGDALVWDPRSGRAVSHKAPGVRPALNGEFLLDGHGEVRPSFALMAEHFLSDEFTPEKAAEITGVDAATIRGLASEIARVAFEEQIEIDQPWTDWKGEHHETMIGRPVSMHAMRGISAHSNGFQTCRAIHLLQILIGSIECPGGFRFKPPYPRAPEYHPRPACGLDDVRPGLALKGPPLGYPLGPEELAVDENGKPLRIDKAFSWEHPLSVHGMMHMVIANAYAGDPYKIDVLFMYMANMSWNSSMNSRGVMEMLEAKDPDTGEYVIPKIIYSDAYNSEMVAYADLILPDTTYLERHDCISVLDRPISEPESLNDSIRWPVVEPDRDVRGFQSVLLDLGARLGLPGMVSPEGEPVYADYADYIVNHQRKPGIGPLIGWRGENGDQFGRGVPHKDQLKRYIENGGFCEVPLPKEALFYKHANAAYMDFAVEVGLADHPTPVTFQLYNETLQKFRLAAQGFGDHQPPEHLRERLKMAFDPLPIWYKPFEEARVDTDYYNYHALTQRPMAMYHSWGSQNAWLRQIHTWNPMYIPAEICAEVGLKDGDWAWIISHHGRIKVPVKMMKGVNSKTIWTWNAIGKRKGAWNLSGDAPESQKGFLLNHLISELLPKGVAHQGRVANSDPVTGQAAWFDLRVHVEKADPDEAAMSYPQFEAQPLPAGLEPAPDNLEFGRGRRKP